MGHTHLLFERACKSFAAVLVTGLLALPAGADDAVSDALEPMRQTKSLVIPLFDADAGRVLFVDKGCVFCHQVNGIGGRVAPPLDAGGSNVDIEPLDFVVRMWRGASAMIALQKEELGYRIDLEPEELAALIGFAYDLEAQRAFSLDDLPPEMEKLFIDEPFDGWTELDATPPVQLSDRPND